MAQKRRRFYTKRPRFQTKMLGVKVFGGQTIGRFDHRRQRGTQVPRRHQRRCGQGPHAVRLVDGRCRSPPKAKTTAHTVGREPAWPAGLHSFRPAEPGLCWLDPGPASPYHGLGPCGSHPMKFVDEATIDSAGNGGNGCSASAARSSSRSAGRTVAMAGAAAACTPWAIRNLNTLIDYRYARRHEARAWRTGRGSDHVWCGGRRHRAAHARGHHRLGCRDRRGAAELLARRGAAGQRAATAASATCTSKQHQPRPRQKTPGWPGEQRS